MTPAERAERWNIAADRAAYLADALPSAGKDRGIVGQALVGVAAYMDALVNGASLDLDLDADLSPPLEKRSEHDVACDVLRDFQRRDPATGRHPDTGSSLPTDASMEAALGVLHSAPADWFRQPSAVTADGLGIDLTWELMDTGLQFCRMVRVTVLPAGDVMLSVHRNDRAEEAQDGWFIEDEVMTSHDVWPWVRWVYGGPSPRPEVA